MKKTILMTMAACMFFGLTGCDEKKAAPAEEPAAKADGAKAGDTKADDAKPKAAEKAPEKGATNGAVALVTVTKAGSEFDPAVDIAQMPEGAYYCDMGTVHYARMDEGDGKCGLCGMKLKHKAAAKAGGAKAGDAKDHDHGDHDHGDHGH